MLQALSNQVLYSSQSIITYYSTLWEFSFYIYDVLIHTGAWNTAWRGPWENGSTSKEWRSNYYTQWATWGWWLIAWFPHKIWTNGCSIQSFHGCNRKPMAYTGTSWKACRNLLQHWFSRRRTRNYTVSHLLTCFFSLQQFFFAHIPMITSCFLILTVQADIYHSACSSWDDFCAHWLHIWFWDVWDGECEGWFPIWCGYLRWGWLQTTYWVRIGSSFPSGEVLCWHC